MMPLTEPEVSHLLAVLINEPPLTNLPYSEWLTLVGEATEFGIDGMPEPHRTMVMEAWAFRRARLKAEGITSDPALANGGKP